MFQKVTLFFTLCSSMLMAQDAIRSGIPWFDDSLNTVSAHGACIVPENGKYYLFGECKGDSSNAFVGFNCYSSDDLSHWKFERQALPLQKDGALGPNRVGERVKVMKCPKTGEFVMYMHTDNLGYKDPVIGYATSPSIDGEYTFRGALLFNGKPIRKWDMGVFQDSDGSGYLLIHHGNVFKLSDDYKSITEQVLQDMGGGEAPTVFKKDGTYFWLTSHLTSWERNDNEYFTASSLAGPWTSRGLFAPQGSLTWNAQSTYVLPICGSKDTTYLFMGDRWSFPCQRSAATYVWLPLEVNDSTLSLPYQEAWVVNGKEGTWAPAENIRQESDQAFAKQVKCRGKWKKVRRVDHQFVYESSDKGASISLTFVGEQIGFYAMAGPNCGYARVMLADQTGKTVLNAMVDLYVKYEEHALKFLSPKLPKGPYKMTVTVLGMHSVWTDKSKKIYGSTGDNLRLGPFVF